jgi:transposase InsO family protein
MIIVRYADDVIVGLQHHEDAQRFRKELVERLRDFGLEINEQKSRLIRFGRYAEQQHKERGLGKPLTLDFLGFTHYCGRSSNGGFAVRRRSVRKRVTRKLKEIRLELKKRRHAPVSQQVDRGSQYTSMAFGNRCRQAGVRLSMGSAGDAYDNALCESFFATLECELMDRKRLTEGGLAKVMFLSAQRN